MGRDKRAHMCLCSLAANNQQKMSPSQKKKNLQVVSLLFLRSLTRLENALTQKQAQAAF